MVVSAAGDFDNGELARGGREIAHEGLEFAKGVAVEVVVDPAALATIVHQSGVLQHAEATFDPLPFDAAAARAFGLITAAVLAAGRRPRRRLADLMIASIANVNGIPLYTTNPDDFTGLDDLVTVVAVVRPR